MIKLGILQDDFGTMDHTPEEEREQIVESLNNMGLAVELGSYGSSLHKAIECDPELLVVDYGGAASAYGMRNRAEWEMRAIHEWASEHPGRLVLLWSSFTQYVYEELEEVAAESLGNVMRYAFYEEEQNKKIRSWFGIAEVEEND